LGLPTDRVLFLFTFDFNSNVGRKNPEGVIDAFAKAFPQRGPASPLLVLKSINIERHPEFAAHLQERVERVGGHLINAHLSQQDMANLFDACDVYVSLHRSEGFGLGMAEAMSVGKPVIATGYSGNLAFMNVANSCLVGYHLRPVTGADHLFNPGAAPIYPEGALWAEPDLDQAAEWMRMLAADERLRERIGQFGRETISSGFSEEAASRIAVSRLSALSGELLGERYPLRAGVTASQ
jgi:glycosyltransferase involved in cell wall biosynthesis